MLFSPVSFFPCHGVVLRNAAPCYWWEQPTLAFSNCLCEFKCSCLFFPSFSLRSTCKHFLFPLCLEDCPHSCILYPHLVYFSFVNDTYLEVFFCLAFWEASPVFFFLNVLQLVFWLYATDFTDGIHLNGNAIFIVCLFKEETGRAFMCLNRGSEHFLTKLLPEDQRIN